MRKNSDRSPFAKKSLGQNFLSDPNYIRKIVQAIGTGDGDEVLEIGPGRGALTRALIDSGAKVTAIEVDADLVPLLHSEFDSTGRFRLIEGDALEADYDTVCGGRRMKLAANLPYYISTAILQRLAAAKDNFSSLVMMLQKEVVERITAGPGSSERGYLTVMIEAGFDSEKLFDVPPNAFRPVPKVWSSVVRLTPKDNASAHGEPDLFRRLVSAGFAQRRKTILNNLKASRVLESQSEWHTALEQAHIDFGRRAETLTLQEWKDLTTQVQGRRS